MNLTHTAGLVIILLTLSSIAVFAQSSNRNQTTTAQSAASQTAVTRDGRTVILKSDGTWEYAKEADDSKVSSGEAEKRTLLEVSTDQLSFVGKPVEVTGTLEPISFYWSGYSQAQDTHLAFSIYKSGGGGGRAFVYMRRGEAANKLRQTLLDKGGKLEGSFVIEILKERYMKGDVGLIAELIDYKPSPK
jgi:hypothetical protein